MQSRNRRETRKKFIGVFSSKFKNQTTPVCAASRNDWKEPQHCSALINITTEIKETSILGKLTEEP